MATQKYQSAWAYIGGCIQVERMADQWYHASQNGHTPEQVRSMYAEIEALKRDLDAANLRWKSSRTWRDPQSPDNLEGRMRFRYEQDLARESNELIGAYGKYVACH